MPRCKWNVLKAKQLVTASTWSLLTTVILKTTLNVTSERVSLLSNCSTLNHCWFICVSRACLTNKSSWSCSSHLVSEKSLPENIFENSTNWENYTLKEQQELIVNLPQGRITKSLRCCKWRLQLHLHVKLCKMHLVCDNRVESTQLITLAQLRFLKFPCITYLRIGA